jgi:hypothetical protein
LKQSLFDLLHYFFFSDQNGKDENWKKMKIEKMENFSIFLFREMQNFNFHINIEKFKEK